MKLPGESFDRPIGTLGRDTSDLTQVSSAQFQTASARGQVARAFEQAADVAQSWAEADERLTAQKALADYRANLASITTRLAARESIPIGEIPDGISVKRTETGADGEEIERETVPSWEVGPAIFDQAERQLARRAQSQVRHRLIGAELGTQIENARTTAASGIQKHYFEGRRQDLIGKMDSAVQSFVQVNDPDAAKRAIDEGVKAGIITPHEGEKQKKKVVNDAANLNTTQLISLSEDPVELERIGHNVLFKPSVLTDEQKRMHYNAAIAKSDRILVLEEKAGDKERKTKSRTLLGELSTRVRFENYLPSAEELKQAASVLEPADYLSFIGLVDRKDGSSGGLGSTDATIGMEVQKSIMALANQAQSGIPVDQRVDMVYAKINSAFGQGKLSLKDRDQYILDLDRYRDRITVTDPRYKAAEDIVEAGILPPRGILANMGFDDSSRLNSIVVQMKIELAEARNADPKIDPQQWVYNNLPRFKTQANDKIFYPKLYLAGVGSIVVYNDNGTFNYHGTRGALDAARNARRISSDVYRQTINIIEAVRGERSAIEEAARLAAEKRKKK